MTKNKDTQAVFTRDLDVVCAASCGVATAMLCQLHQSYIIL